MFRNTFLMIKIVKAWNKFLASVVSCFDTASFGNSWHLPMWLMWSSTFSSVWLCYCLLFSLFLFCSLYTAFTFGFHYCLSLLIIAFQMLNFVKGNQGLEIIMLNQVTVLVQTISIIHLLCFAFKAWTNQRLYSRRHLLRVTCIVIKLNIFLFKWLQNGHLYHI